MTRKARVRWLVLLVPLALGGLSFLLPWTAAQEVSSERVLGLRSAYGFVGIGWMRHTEEIPPEETVVRTEEEWFLEAQGVTPEGKLREFLDGAVDLPALQFFDVADVEVTGHPYQSKVILWYFAERHLVRWNLICFLVFLGILAQILLEARRSGSSEP